MAVWPRLARRLGITSRQSSCGVRISSSPSCAIKVFAARMISPPRYSWVKTKRLVRAVIAQVTSAKTGARCGAGQGAIIPA